jgi:Acyl-coenzyme A:6-aminopenicillanic acid acyl-transferase
MTKSVLTPLFAMILSAFAIQNVPACTIFTVVQADSVLFGGNEDQTPNDSFLVVDTSGRYGAVYVATPWGGGPLLRQTGVNEKGLCYDSNWIPDENIVPHPNRKPLKELPFVIFLKECATVEEVLKRLPTFDWGDRCDYQLHFADATGDAAVIHPGKDGELTYTRKQKGDGYLISTNFNLELLCSGDWSCWRYSTANKMLSSYEAARTVSVESARDVLQATSQSDAGLYTIYSELYDLKNLRVYLYYSRDYSSPIILDVKTELKNWKKGMQKPLKELIPVKG